MYMYTNHDIDSIRDLCPFVSQIAHHPYWFMNALSDAADVLKKTRLLQRQQRLQITKIVLTARAEKGLNNSLLKLKQGPTPLVKSKRKMRKIAENRRRNEAIESKLQASKIAENRRRNEAIDSKLQAIDKKLRRLETKQRRDECEERRRAKTTPTTRVSCTTRDRQKATLKSKMRVFKRSRMKQTARRSESIHEAVDLCEDIDRKDHHLGC